MTPEESRTIIQRGRAEPGWWAHEILGIELWDDQVKALCSWRDNRKTSWRSANGCGKTLADAVGVLWVGSNWEDTSILTTATTFTQIKGSVWNEVALLDQRAKYPLGCTMLQTEIKWPHGSRAFAITAPPTEKHAAKMAGYRGRKRTFVLGDEASGLSSSILEGIDGMLSGADAHLLLTGNPLDPTTEFKRTFDREGVVKIKTDAFSSPNFTAFGVTLEDIVHGTWQAKITGPYPTDALTTPEWAAGFFEKCGRNIHDPRFVARVLAEFPEASKDTLIPMHWIEAAIVMGSKPPALEEPKEPRRIGTDVARYGDDDSVIARRKWIRGKIVDALRGHDTMRVVGSTKLALDTEKAESANIDSIGVGGPVVDRGREQGWPFSGINVSMKSSTPEIFMNIRSELWWSMRERFEATYRASRGERDANAVPIQPGILLDERDELLAAELNAPRWKPNSRGQIVVEPKEETKKRLQRSPDRADALILAFAPDWAREEEDAQLEKIRALGRM